MLFNYKDEKEVRVESSSHISYPSGSHLEDRKQGIAWGGSQTDAMGQLQRQKYRKKKKAMKGTQKEKLGLNVLGAKMEQEK